MFKQKINRALGADQLAWSRDGDSWLLQLGRRKVGRVVRDESFPGMWRPVLAGGRLGDMANLARAKSVTLDAAAREIEHAQKCATPPEFTGQNGAVFKGSTSQIAQTDEPAPRAPSAEAASVGLWKGPRP